MNPLTVKGTLKRGLKVGETLHKEFELREAMAGDVFDAEGEATPDRPTSFRSALLARQLLRIGTFEGPFTLQVLGTLSARDLKCLLEKQLELDLLGEGEQLDVPGG